MQQLFSLKRIQHGFIIVLCVFYLLPFLVLLMLALSKSGLGSTMLFNVHDLEPGNFVIAWQKSKLGTSLMNSVIISVSSVVLIIFCASQAGYAIGRFPTWFHRLVLGIFLACMMLPGIINTVPLYTLLIKLQGINTRWSMILVCATNALPFSVFLYTGFVKTIPREIEESAIVDGCSWFSTFWRITIHFLTPVTAAVILLNGIGIWNNYAQAVFFLQTAEVRTVPLAISMFFQQYGARWQLVAAAALIGLLPVVLVFLNFQRFFIKGITSGALKG